MDKETILRLSTYSEELNLDLQDPADRFRWLLASVLFAKPISAAVAEETFRLLRKARLDTPERLRKARWGRIVRILDEGGYARYDYSTATNLQILAGQIIEEYGDLESLHGQATDPRDLERRLDDLRGVGPTAINILLRELRGVWPKANPEPSKIARSVASELGIRDVKGNESRLIRFYIEYCKKGRCDLCDAKGLCKQRTTRKAKGK
jgi:endonuclease III